MSDAIFLSYSSAQADLARRLELALTAEGHSVFRDRSDLPAGDAFDRRIREAVQGCELFVFLVTPESVAAGHYAMTELAFAERRFPDPSHHVLPVLVAPTPFESIPEFLRAVTVLQPKGDVVAEVVAAVDRMRPSWRRRLRGPAGVAAIAVVAMLAALLGWQLWTRAAETNRQTREATVAVEQSRIAAEAGNYAVAWGMLRAARQALPHSTPVADAQERLAMDWLESARGSQLDGSLGSIADTTLPVLSRGAAEHTGERAADLIAHMGWAEFLRGRDGLGGDPVKHYRRAAEIDSFNVYAHAFWGFHVLAHAEPMVLANRHFDIALASSRARAFVRHMQISGFLWGSEPEYQDQAIRVANDIRKNGETMPEGMPERPDADRFWNVYDQRLINEDHAPSFIATLLPADHLATFQWLFPESTFRRTRYLYLDVLAQLTERTGDRAAALAAYRRLEAELAKEEVRGGRVFDHAREGLERLAH